MAKKVYRTYHLKGLSLHLFDNFGKVINVEFKGGIQIDSTAKFSTSDENVQSALEACSGFNRDFYLESEREDNVPAAPAPVVEEPKLEEKVEDLTDVKDSRRFRNLPEMRNAIKELGIEIKDDCNYMEAKAIAKKNGYDFQIKR